MNDAKSEGDVVRKKKSRSPQSRWQQRDGVAGVKRQAQERGHQKSGGHLAKCGVVRDSCQGKVLPEPQVYAVV
jgi:hypothetical protein